MIQLATALGLVAVTAFAAYTLGRLRRVKREKGQLAAIIEAAPYPVATISVDGRLEYLNRAGRSLAGLEETGPLGGSRMASLHGDGEAIDRAIAQAAAGRPWSGESAIGGTPVFAAFFPLPGVGGRPPRVAAVLRDITSRKAMEAKARHAEAELKEAKEAAEDALAESRRLAAVLEATSDMVCIADARGRMVYMNASERRALGIGEHEDIGSLSVLDQYPPESAERVRNEALPRTATHGTWAGELERLTRDGRRIPVSLVGVALPGADGRPEYLAAVARDITDRVRLESDLRQARDAAEAANRAKSTFLANMSHEIRTPMNAVIGMTGLLLGTRLDERQRDLVETVRTGGDALLALINDILDFSKIEAGRMELESQGFDLRACLESAVDLLAPRAAEKGLALSYTMAPEVPEAIVGDAGRLRQVLVNLVGNAVKFTEVGEVVVSVSLEEGVEQTLRFCVRDTGPGITEAQREHLFQPFTQLDGAATRQHGGTGLGLAISRRLTELMGGRLWVESPGVPGQGSMFRFTLQAEAAPSPLRPWHRGRQPALNGRVLLIVDDGPSVRRTLGRQAQTWGMSAVEAGSSAEALQAIREGARFDVAIVDVDLSGAQNGWDLARRVKALRPALPLVGLVAVGTDPAAHPDSSLFQAFLTKPVKPSQLYDVLVGVFVGKAEMRPARPASGGEAPVLAERLPLRILLAEDVPLNQKFALMAFETMGYRADVAANGLEVLQALRRQRYDVVFMDMQMPHLDGTGATRRIRSEWPAAEQPRIVAMTANAMQGDRETCLAAGMDDYVSKPVYLHELREALERCCPDGCPAPAA
jgi:PAS domain S-box-containing protein